MDVKTLLNRLKPLKPRPRIVANEPPLDGDIRSVSKNLEGGHDALYAFSPTTPFFIGYVDGGIEGRIHFPAIVITRFKDISLEILPPRYNPQDEEGLIARLSGKPIDLKYAENAQSVLTDKSSLPVYGDLWLSNANDIELARTRIRKYERGSLRPLELSSAYSKLREYERRFKERNKTYQILTSQGEENLIAYLRLMRLREARAQGKDDELMDKDVARQEAGDMVREMERDRKSLEEAIEVHRRFIHEEGGVLLRDAIEKERAYIRGREDWVKSFSGHYLTVKSEYGGVSLVVRDANAVVDIAESRHGTIIEPQGYTPHQVSRRIGIKIRGIEYGGPIKISYEPLTAK